MGTPDTIFYTCCNCKKETSSQTKLGKCMLSNLYEGDTFCPDNEPNMILLMKDPCESCKVRNAVIVIDGKIRGFTKDTWEYREEAWGEIISMKDDLL